MATTSPLSRMQSTQSRGRALQLRKITARVLFALALVPLLTQTGGQAADVQDPLRYSDGFLVTGNYVVGGVDFTSNQNPADQNGLATGTINFNDARNNKVPADADIVGASLLLGSDLRTWGEADRGRKVPRICD